jgi:hypothetical protein
MHNLVEFGESSWPKKDLGDSEFKVGVPQIEGFKQCLAE